MTKITKKHTSVNYTSGNTGRKYIVLHYTGNKTDTAVANANYFKSEYRGASAHYFVDSKNIYEVVSPKNTSWAVGMNYGHANLFGTCTNGNSISIEMCSTSGKIDAATITNAVNLTKSLMKKYSIPASRVVRHYDVCSKVCPGWKGWGSYTGDSSLWKSFKEKLSTAQAEPIKKNEFKVIVKISNLNIRKSPGMSSKVVKTCKPGTYTIVDTTTKDGYTWGKLKSGSGWIALKYTTKL